MSVPVKFDVLYEAAPETLPDLPPGLSEAYGPLRLPPDVLYANFASSLDGVVAFESEVPGSAGTLLSQRDPGDRFLIGLLRAWADAVIVGAGTLRGERRHRWTPGHVFPDAAGEFAELRRRQGLSPMPQLVVVTATGDLPAGALALSVETTVLTTASGLARLRGRLPASARVAAVAGGDGGVDLAEAVRSLRERGLRRLLSEAGPRLTGGLVSAGLVDELFLTLSPVVAGRAGPGRPGFVEGASFLPVAGRWGDLLSVRRRASLLFLRYRLQVRGGTERLRG